MVLLEGHQLTGAVENQELRGHHQRPEGQDASRRWSSRHHWEDREGGREEKHNREGESQATLSCLEWGVGCLLSQVFSVLITNWVTQVLGRKEKGRQQLQLIYPKILLIPPTRCGGGMYMQACLHVCRCAYMCRCAYVFRYTQMLKVDAGRLP